MPGKYHWNMGSVLLLLSFFACSPKHIDPGGDSLVIFPSPPDTTRIQFLTRISNSLDVTGKRSGFASYVIGGEDEGEPIIKPYGLAIHQGIIYVCDTILGGLEIIDLNEQTFEYFQPGGRGRIKKPINCFVDQEGLLYVSDADRHQIVIFDENREYLDSFGAAGTKPTDVFVYGDKIWVSDIQNHKIYVYSKSTHELLFSFPELEPDVPGHLFQPSNLWVEADQVFVSDFGDFLIKTYTTEGKYLDTIGGGFGDGLGQFARPKGIAVDRDLNIYVVDAAFENVQIFNREGRLLMFFGGDYKGPGYMWLPAKVVIDYDNSEYFQQYVDESFSLKYLIFVTNQYGPDKISIYGYVEPNKQIPESQ